MGFIRTLFGKDTTTDVIALLTLQHSQLDELFEKLDAHEGNRREVFMLLADMLAAHATIEERLFYPAVMAKDTSSLLRESVEEHLSIKRVLADMIAMKPDDEQFAAKLSVLKEQVGHHAHKEEEVKLFPKVRLLMDADERAALGNEMLVLYEQLMESHPYKNVMAETAAPARLPAVR